MARKPIFEGAATALITPTTPEGVDYEALGKLIDWQIEKGIDALVIAGSTGEGKTLSVAEHKEVLRYSAERIAGRVPMIAGTGSNELTVSIDMSQYACAVGADALLVVTPYYIKATQNGLVKMYSMIADAVTKPLILYNVPSRTGVNIEPETYARLADHGNIAGIKEANSDISKIVTTAALTAGKLDLYSGNDDQIVPILSLGGKGVIFDTFPVRTSDPYDLAPEDREYILKTGDFWRKNCISAAIDDIYPEEYNAEVLGNGVLNFRASGNCQHPIGHFVGNFWTVLDKGLGSVAREAAEKKP